MVDFLGCNGIETTEGNSCTMQDLSSQNLECATLSRQASGSNLLEFAMSKFKLEVCGLIHIGASTGQELHNYRDLQIPNLMFIEADPEVAAILGSRLNQESGEIAFNFAASNQNGEANFMRTNNQYSSSLLELHLHKEAHKEVIAKDVIKVSTQRMDDFLANINNSNVYNAIVIDIQGAELMALQGTVNTLKQIDFIISEVEYIELYKGGVLINTLDEFLLNNGFLRMETRNATSSYGDALYIKQFKLNQQPSYAIS